MEQPFKRKLFYIFPVLFTFCLPFGSYILSWIIVGWTLAGFFNIDYSRVRTALRRWEFWTLYVFFFITLLSAYLSDNVSEALFSIEVKMSCVIFPFLIFCFSWPIAILKRCVLGFVSGCFFASLYLICRGLYYSSQGHPEYLFYNDFSMFIHTSYFAMYLNLAITFIFALYPTWFKSQPAVIRSSYFFATVFVVTVFLCASKLGLISLVLTAVSILVYRLHINFDIKRLFIVVASLAVILFAVYTVFPTPLERFVRLSNFDVEKVDKTSVESTAVRALIWQQAVEIIKQNFFFGTGVGDANDELYKAYNDNGLTGAFSHKLNAHNQFLQTFIGMGIFSFILLFLITVGEIVKALIKRRFLLFVFASLVTINFMVESMLQRAAGVVFFSFFYCFLNLVSEKQFLMDDHAEL